VSTLTNPPAAMERVLPPGRYGFFDLVRSEWTKIKTVRSTMWTIGVTIVLGIGIGALVTTLTSSHWSSMNLGSRVSFDPTQSSLVGLLFAQFAIGILGVLVISAEYTTGTIRATFSAAPNRSRVFGAKIVVFGVLSFVVAEVTSFVAFFLGQFLLSSPATHATLSSPGAFRAVFGGGLFVCALGLLAMGWDDHPSHGGCDQCVRGRALGPSYHHRGSAEPVGAGHSQVHAGSNRGRHAHDEGSRLWGVLTVGRPVYYLRLRRGTARNWRVNVGKTGRLIFCSDEDLTSVEARGPAGAISRSWCIASLE